MNPALTHELPGSEVVCWELAIALPVTLPVTLLAPSGAHAPGAAAVVGFAYVSLVSQFLGLWIWVRGLPASGVAKGGQVQLGQPLLTLLWSGWLLGESLTWQTVTAAAAVMAAGVATLRGRVAVQARSAAAAPRRPPE